MSTSVDVNLVDVPVMTTDTLSFKEQEWKSEHEQILADLDWDNLSNNKWFTER